MYHKKSFPHSKTINWFELCSLRKKAGRWLRNGTEMIHGMAVTALFTLVLRYSHVCWEAQLMLVWPVLKGRSRSNYITVLHLHRGRQDVKYIMWGRSWIMKYGTYDTTCIGAEWRIEAADVRTYGRMEIIIVKAIALSPKIFKSRGSKIPGRNQLSVFILMKPPFPFLPLGRLTHKIISFGKLFQGKLENMTFILCILN